jgi:hypothetical protein
MLIYNAREFRDSKFDDSSCCTLLNYSSILTLQGALFKGSNNYSHPAIECTVLGLLLEKKLHHNELVTSRPGQYDILNVP